MTAPYNPPHPTWTCPDCGRVVMAGERCRVPVEKETK